jgi:hypothetical protein
MHKAEVSGFARVDCAACCSSSPKGLRFYDGQTWASLRLATFSSFTALSYASLPGVPPAEATAARCLARSQLGYVAGDTGRSYIVGVGTDPPQQVHHRDAACTLDEDAAGFCEGSAAFWFPACAATIRSTFFFTHSGRSGLQPRLQLVPHSLASWMQIWRCIDYLCLHLQLGKWQPHSSSSLCWLGTCVLSLHEDVLLTYRSLGLQFCWRDTWK